MKQAGDHGGLVADPEALVGVRDATESLADEWKEIA